jgi:branched-chain amino acid transport system substrate-binding protein
MKFTRPPARRRRRGRRAWLLTATLTAALAAAAAVAGCSSTPSSAPPATANTGATTPAASNTASSTATGSPAAATGSPLTVADVAPFSGPDAALGPTYLATCYGATSAINAAGGVDGHPLTCKSVDTRGDPADAVPAVNQMFATTSNLALVIGCTSDEAASVVPIINSHKMAMFCMTGQSEFDSVHFPYFYRLVPPDLEESYAMVAIAQELGYKRIALAFGNDIGSQTFIQPAIAGLAKAGITMTTNQTLDLTATTFRTEAEAIIQSHPDAIMTEALGNADPTLFSEIQQLNGGKMIPIIATSAAISPPFFKAAAAAVGASTFVANFHADNLVTETSGPAYQAFSAALLSQQGKVPGTTGNFTTYLSAPGGVHLYDGINLAALAMVMSKSTDPSVYAPDMITIGNGAPGATVCYSFVSCDSLLKAGTAIRYEGPGGPTSFDSFHDSTGIFQVDTYSANGAVNVTGNITAAQLRAISG